MIYDFFYKTRAILPLLLTAFIIASCGGDDDNSENGENNVKVVNVNKNTVSTDNAVMRLEFPRLSSNGHSLVIVHRTTSTEYDKDGVNYAIEWDSEKKSQRWSCYQMHKGYSGNYSRVVDGYPDDPDLPSDAYWDRDYIYGSGFQHGHICPSADRTFSYDANYQTFYMSNMQPQYKQFNAYEGSNKGLWLMMENKVTAMARNLGKSDTMYVCKGGTIDSEEHILKRISGKLIVPRYFFMAILIKESRGYSALGFWAEQTTEWGTNENLLDHAVSIDKLEELTGIDFFCNLPDDKENEVEKQFYPKYWGLE